MARARLTGVLLVGGASRRFGSPKALAPLDGETLAARAWRILGEVCDERIAVGKPGELELPFAVLPDGHDVRAPIAGVVAGLRAASAERAIVLPVDMPAISPDDLLALAGAGGDVAMPQTGPLPGAYARRALAVLERRLADGRLALRDAVSELDVRVVPLDLWRLANVNTPADLERVEVRERALAAAADVARAQGIAADGAVILSDWNDTIVHLAPSPLVARVGTSRIAWDKAETAARELAVVRHATARGAPVVAPAAGGSAGPHAARGLVLTLWHHVDEIAGSVAPEEQGRALRALHEALADYARPLPALEERLDRAQAALADPARVPALAERDRLFLAETLLRLRGELALLGLRAVPIHGGAHESNLLATPAGARWIDFDTACRGPREWDLAHLDPEAAGAYGDVSMPALAVARELVSAEVATWCWASHGRAPEVDEAAAFHLARLRAAS